MSSWTDPPADGPSRAHPAYAVQLRHRDDHAQQANEQAFKDPVELARELLDAVPLALNLLPPDEVRTVLDQLPQHLR